MKQKPSKYIKKTRLRQRILFTFSYVLFFSLFWTGVFFNIVIRMFITEDEHYHVIEQVVTGRAGFILFVLMTVMFLLAEIASYFLANSITRPIEKLGDFALDMSKGNFESNDFEFIDIELENLNAALNESVRRLGVSDKAQKDFFQNASHELRTPIMSIKIYAEGIAYGVMEPNQAAETIMAETDRLSELVTDLLYITKIDTESTAYKPDKIDLIAMIEACIKHHKAVAEKKGIGFKFDFEGSHFDYECVPELLSRAVDNLISNAIRYAVDEVTIQFRKNEMGIQIVVMDDGDGIDEETLPQVFERFYKGSGGITGIGLAIVKSIAEQHKGYVSAENAKDKGAVFTISLPM